MFVPLPHSQDIHINCLTTDHTQSLFNTKAFKSLRQQHHLIWLTKYKKGNSEPRYNTTSLFYISLDLKLNSFIQLFIFYVKQLLLAMLSKVSPYFIQHPSTCASCTKLKLV